MDMELKFSSIATGDEVQRAFNYLISKINQGSGGAAGTTILTTRPTVTHDASLGYVPGSRIYVPSDENRVVNEDYICHSNAVGAAIWKPVNGYYTFKAVVAQVDTGVQIELQINSIIKNSFPAFTISGTDGAYIFTGGTGSFANIPYLQSGVFYDEGSGRMIMYIVIKLNNEQIEISIRYLEVAGGFIEAATLMSSDTSPFIFEIIMPA